ncbi:MAG: aldehyde dehydrogenase [Gammaproteobacteria bacterium]|nr:aldehyde dehydrogenase [Gammaproteobacteria bacterium]NIR84539.1 aldehyde dehydrogenase [Gammaproteobacteria bacterium]NIR90442.1 aldehyde dehydrogenase [Gammaproteobacteria bacterium]NIU05590.1 aldehyde dehydrogenase [Gammaproteobacteria bacterium]NIV52729.1 aldehyde dehydrogenase family protein [Gammaproteobacteria bacterium]
MVAVQSAQEWKAQAQRLSFRNRAFIGGSYVEAASGKTYDCVSPIDGNVLTRVAECDAEDLDRAVASARTAFESGAWRTSAPKQRKKVLLALADLMAQHREELALLETLDMGKPIRDALSIDVPLAIDCIRWYAEAVDKLYDEVAPTAASTLALVTREPVGVVGAVVPWNFPLLMASWKLGPALATGNSVVLKPAEQSPLSALRVAELAMEAGIPEGVLNVVPGFGETAGRAIGLHMDVDAVAFTGSAEVGKYFLEYAGRSNMKQVSLECGGKTPNIVMADAPDLDTAAKAAAMAIFFNQGECCHAGSRLLVHESVKDAVVERVMAVGSRMQPGDPLDPETRMGAIVDDVQTERVMGYIEHGTREGAVLKMGGHRVREDSGGYYVEPTVFDNVGNHMKIAQEEIFGPVLSVLTFRDSEEGARLGNQSVYGLAAAVWTRDISVALKTARALRAGTVWVNNYDESDITVPFGGYKQSGFGRDKSLHALEKYTHLKTTWIKTQ